MQKSLYTFFLGLLFTGQAHAWEIAIEENEYLPNAFVAVDKGRETLYHFDKTEAEGAFHVFPSIHGRREGDKQIEGDLKTPEGVYFVLGKIDYSLDFGEYGSQAYALNYPNPVDRLRGKTGSGIWVHSKGKPIEGQRTRGCVAIDLEDIDILGPYLEKNMPIIIAQDLKGSFISSTFVEKSQEAESSIETSNKPLEKDLHGEAEESTINKTEKYADDVDTLIEKTKAWNKAWAERNPQFFDFYNQESYAKAQNQKFSTFQSQKESLFHTLDFIFIEVGKIYALQGSDYWVTWFEQYYHASNHKAQGVRRLYWQENKDGELSIVGMEWIPNTINKKNALLDYAKKTVPQFLESWKESCLALDVNSYKEHYTKDAKQNTLQGKEVIATQAQDIWTQKQVQTILFTDIELKEDTSGIVVRFVEKYQDSSGEIKKGVKELLLRPHKGTWLIAKETRQNP